MTVAKFTGPTLTKTVIVTKKHSILDMRPSVSLAKNIKRKEPVFALLNREIIESITATRYPEDASI